MNRLIGACGLGLLLLYHSASAQVIEIQSNGLKYQALTRSGVTVMYARLPGIVHQYSIVQVAVTNGSEAPYIIRPEDFTFERTDGTSVRAVSARSVVDVLINKGNANDVIRLVTAYEAAIFGNPQLKSTRGFEARRQAAMAANGTKVKAAAVASALAMVLTKLPAGDSTDGAIFFPTDGKPMGSGKMIVRTSTDVFQFNAE